MPFAGSYTPPNPGETQPFSMDFTRQLAAGDTLLSATTGLDAIVGTDLSASSWLLGPPAITGNIVSQNVGGAIPGGLQAGVTYVLIFTAKTVSGRTLVNYGNIMCVATDA